MDQNIEKQECLLKGMTDEALNIKNENVERKDKILKLADLDIQRTFSESDKNKLLSQTKTQPIQITFCNVRVRTDQGKFLVKGVSGTVKPGKFIALLGPSGCGKTTLMNTITGLLDENLTGDGQVYLNKELINSDHQSNLIAYCEHKIMGYENLTVKTQVEYAASLYNKNSDEVANNIIDGLYLTGEKDKEYQVCSGGQQVRISIATNLTTKASIYILDEPLTGLDSYSARKAIDAIKELSDLDKTVLLSVHQPSETLFDQFDEFILMTNGSIVFQGTKEEAIKYFASIGFVKEKKYVSYPDFFLKIITLEKDSSNNLTSESKNKYDLLVDSWLSQAKELEIEYTEPINTKFKKFSVANKTARILMSKIFSLYFFYSFINIILPNILVFYDYYNVNKIDLILTKEKLNNLSVIEVLIYNKIAAHLQYNLTTEIRFNVLFNNLKNDSPILIICVLLFYRFLLLSLFGFNLFYKSIKNHKVEYRKGYFSVVEYFNAIYLISIREFIITLICDIATFIYFSKNWKFLSVFIIFYLLSFNFIYLICLILSLSFNESIYFFISRGVKYVLSSVLISDKWLFSTLIFRVGFGLITLNYLSMSTIDKLSKIFSPFNLLSIYNFSIETFLCSLLTLIILNFLIITLNLYKLKTVLKGNYGKFNLLRV